MAERNCTKPGNLLSDRERVTVEDLRSAIVDWDFGTGGHACKTEVSKEGVYDGHLFFGFLADRLTVHCQCGARTDFFYNTSA